MLTHNLHNFSELEDRIALLHMQQKRGKYLCLFSLESQIRHLRENAKNMPNNIRKNKNFTMTIIKVPKNPDRYFRKYESQIILFAGAEHIFTGKWYRPETAQYQ